MKEKKLPTKEKLEKMFAVLRCQKLGEHEYELLKHNGVREIWECKICKEIYLPPKKMESEQ